ncbi:hypothetical protein PQX77_003741 [Marasmius sp. AFHP31]|nr:hypothetical protein PQX77_003741 [Marasmius sp. AFHP31]
MSRLLSLATLSVACAGALVYPAYQGAPDEVDSSSFVSTSNPTDGDTIASTIDSINQKSRVPTNAAPDQTGPGTSVVAVDGQILDSAQQEDSTVGRRLVNRANNRRTDNNWVQVFNGTGLDVTARDASVVGTSYLTYTLVPDNSYNVKPCLAFCENDPDCEFVNLYYERNNDQSTLKCAAFGDVHTAEEKTFQGENGSYIQHSSGWALERVTQEAIAVEGYEQVFGPVDAANNAPHYMGFVLLSRYDPQRCAQECNKRVIDRLGGACKYFNIWRALKNGKPHSYTCSMYYIPTNASTATNTGQGDISVTLSRGYRRTNLITDGDFEKYQCADGTAFCFTNMTSDWIGTSPRGGNYDASIFHYEYYAYRGTGVGLLGSAFGSDSLPGTLTYAHRIRTKKGGEYKIQFFTQSTYSGKQREKDAFVCVVWNGQTIKTLHTGYAPWAYHEVTARGTGNDELAFCGGKAPAFTFIDNIYVFRYY